MPEVTKGYFLVRVSIEHASKLLRTRMIETPRLHALNFKRRVFFFGDVLLQRTKENSRLRDGMIRVTEELNTSQDESRNENECLNF